MDKPLLSILVIDDDKVDQMNLTRAINNSGFEAEITTAGSLEDGLTHVRETPFDCIFVDFSLPGGNGLDFLRSYRTGDYDTPVIMVTSYGDEMVAVDAMKLGASDYLPKQMLTNEGVSQSLRYAIKIGQEKKRNREVRSALEELEKKLTAVIHRTPVILFAVNCDKKITLFQGKGVDQIELDPSRIVGKQLEDVSDKLPVINDLFIKAGNGNEFTQTVEFRNSHFELNIIPDGSRCHGGGGFFGIAFDITDHKKLEQELQRNLSVAQETQKVKEQFLANMSHEIRTPIHGIMSLTNLLLNTELSDDQNTYLNAVKKSADNLLVIINDILDLSKMEAEKMTFESTIFSLNEVILTTCELFRPKAGEKGLKMESDITPNLPRFVKGDPTRLSQIVNNLVNNAIKFTNEGSVTITCNVKDANEKCSMVEFSVTDTGIGIPKEKISTVFELFTQASDDINRKFGGTGLGLSIVKKLVELQGGLIDVSSEIDKGTTFTFSIPFDLPEAYELESMMEAETDTGEEINNGIRILIVEDNDINRLVINKLMKDWDVEIHNAVNGEDAIKRIKAEDFDVVLLDIEMPVMNGYQCIREIRTSLPEGKCNIPVMAMTAHATKEEREKCLNLGMNDYLSKPFDPEDLKAKINALTGIAQQAITAEPLTENFAEVATEEAPRITNLDYVRELSEDNDEFFREFLELFINTTPETLENLNRSIKASDWEGVRQAAHKMKPSLNYLGMTTTRETAVKVEEYAKEKKNVEEIPQMIEQLNADCEKAITEIKAELNSNTITS